MAKRKQLGVKDGKESALAPQLFSLSIACRSWTNQLKGPCSPHSHGDHTSLHGMAMLKPEGKMRISTRPHG